MSWEGGTCMCRQPSRQRLTVNTVCLEAKIIELEASLAEMKEMLGQSKYSVKAYRVYVSPGELFCSAVAEKVTVKQDREFEVASVDREAGCRTVSTQTPVSMEGNPSGIKIICVSRLYILGGFFSQVETLSRKRTWKRRTWKRKTWKRKLLTLS